MNAALIAAVLVAFAALAAALWFALSTAPGVHAARHSCSRFLDFGNTARLTFFHSLDSPESQRFEFEWETLKQATTGANMNVAFSLINVDLMSAFAGKPTPSVEFKGSRAAAEEHYAGPLTSEALLAFLVQKLQIKK